MNTVTSDKRPARERLLAAASELFYDEGVQSVGIDRVIERAGVAKASLYNTFGSKDELVSAYLLERHEARQARMTEGLQRYETPRERLLGVFDVLGEIIKDRPFRGCAFVNASAEARPDSGVAAASRAYRSWTRQLFTDLARDAGADEPEELARRMVVLYDGATIGASMDGDLDKAAVAREMAATLLDQVLPG